MGQPARSTSAAVGMELALRISDDAHGERGLLERVVWLAPDQQLDLGTLEIDVR